MLGTTIGNFQITALLGEGGMGKVYVAQHPTLARKSAIKVLHPDQAHDPVALSRFFTEAKAADSIRHPNIVEIYDYGTLPDGAPYIAMEYLEGETLHDRLGRGPIPLGEALDIIGQAASALGAAHSKEVLHRDLKPDNVFLVVDPAQPSRRRVKIVDFGIAKLQNDLTEVSHRTRTGALIGTPLYMSPEQCLGAKDIGPPSDLYALGVIAYEILCGRPPFEADAVGALINMHVNEPVVSPRKLNPRLPRPVEAVLLKALAKLPENRYRRMEDLQAELEKVRALVERTTPELLASAPEGRQHPLEAATVAATITGAPRSRTASIQSVRYRRQVLGGVALGALAAAVLVFLQRRPPPAAPMMPPPPAAIPTPPTRPPAPVDVTLELVSDPPGATVTVGDEVVGRTPVRYVTRTVPEPIEFVFVLDGYLREAIRALPAEGLEVRARLTPTRHRPAKKPPAARPAPPDDIKSER